MKYLRRGKLNKAKVQALFEVVLKDGACTDSIFNVLQQRGDCNATRCVYKHYIRCLLNLTLLRLYLTSMWLMMMVMVSSSSSVAASAAAPTAMPMLVACVLTARCPLHMIHGAWLTPGSCCASARRVRGVLHK